MKIKKNFFKAFKVLSIAALAAAMGLPYLFAAPSTRPSRHHRKTTQKKYGSIHGRIVYEGGYVHKVKDVIRDEKTCGVDDLVDQSLLTSKDGGLQWAVVSIQDGVKRGRKLSTFNHGKEAVLDQRHCVFRPHVLLVAQGQKMKILNSDPVLHNVRTTSFLNDAFNRVQFKKTNSEVSFEEAELIPVKCDVHGWMNSFIQVVDHPYYSVSAKDGSFSLDGVPPGSYTLHVWHEKLGELDKKVTVRSGRISIVKIVMKAK